MALDNLRAGFAVLFIPGEAGIARLAGEWRCRQSPKLTGAWQRAWTKPGENNSSVVA